jgi:hypothetical protein
MTRADVALPIALATEFAFYRWTAFTSADAYDLGNDERRCYNLLVAGRLREPAQ